MALTFQNLFASPADAQPDNLTVEGRVQTIEPDYGRRTQVVQVQYGSDSVAALLDLNPNSLIGDNIRIHFPHQELVFFGSDERRLN